MKRDPAAIPFSQLNSIGMKHKQRFFQICATSGASCSPNKFPDHSRWVCSGFDIKIGPPKLQTDSQVALTPNCKFQNIPSSGHKLKISWFEMKKITHRPFRTEWWVHFKQPQRPHAKPQLEIWPQNPSISLPPCIMRGNPWMGSNIHDGVTSQREGLH